MIELTNGMCTQYIPSLSIWDLCTKPVIASAEATIKYHAFLTNAAVRPAQFWEQNIYRCEPVDSHDTFREKQNCMLKKKKKDVYFINKPFQI